MSSALLRAEDREAVLNATSELVSSLKDMLSIIKSVAGKPKETVKAQLKYEEKDTLMFYMCFVDSESYMFNMFGIHFGIFLY